MHKLYYAPGACSLAAHIILEEIGKPYQLVLVNTAQGENHGEAFMGLNPKARVPVLVVDDFVLTENPAILYALADSQPQRQFVPHQPILRARCMEWLFWLSSTAHVAYAQILRPQRFAERPEDFPPIVESGHRNLKECFDRIEAAVGEGPFVFGSGISVVDAFLLVFYRWGSRLKYPMDYPRWSRVVQSLMSRPSVQAAFLQEGIRLAD